MPSEHFGQNNNSPGDLLLTHLSSFEKLGNFGLSLFISPMSRLKKKSMKLTTSSSEWSKLMSDRIEVPGSSIAHIPLGKYIRMDAKWVSIIYVSFVFPVPLKHSSNDNFKMIKCNEFGNATHSHPSPFRAGIFCYNILEKWLPSFFLSRFLGKTSRNTDTFVFFKRIISMAWESMLKSDLFPHDT